ncbi:MAG: hypothetical protein JW940_22910 [Polyangiaceae bacterium]|nr:hypothetical protein [Polyangiaceae bacterium]
MCRNSFGSNAASMAGCERFTGWFGAQDNPNVTTRYLQLSRAQLAGAPSPIDVIGSPAARVLD